MKDGDAATMLTIEIEPGQVEEFRAEWLELFGRYPDSYTFSWTFSSWRGMTQTEREVVAVCIKNNKTCGQIATALKHLWGMK